MNNVFDQLKAQRAKEDAQRAEAIAFFGPSRDIGQMRRSPPGQRPRCACCDRPYGERATRYSSERYAIGRPILAYRGNHILLEEQVRVGPSMGPGNEPGAAVSRTTWDGTSYRAKSGTDPFCTARCALAFAGAAYRAGYRMVEKDKV